MNSEFDATYRNFYPRLFRIATKMLQDSEGAKDVVQDVFTAYYFAMSDKKVINNTKNWLIRSTINKGVDYKRKNSKNVRTDDVLQNINDIFFFNEAEEKGKNSFHVYQVKNGKTISENTLKCEDYDLAITKKRLAYYNGYFYGIQGFKGCEGNPLRLVRFKIEAE